MAVTITINDKQYEAEEGRWLIDVCNELGLDIPHFCYHPGLGPDGNCRMCQVEFVTERGSRIGTSCNMKVADGMAIRTDSEQVKQVRASVEEFLLLNHPLDCPICDKAGECTLQNYYMQHDAKDSRQEFKRFTKRKALDIGPTMVLDQERCVLCDRCVRFLRDVAGTEELHIAGRGHESYLTTFPGKSVESPYSLNTVDLCPVGALTSKDFRFASPTWFLDRTPSTCTTCARGCAIEIDSRENRIHRLRPRYNLYVNGYWMCDEGRLNYKFVNTERIDADFVNRKGTKYETSHEAAMLEIRSLLGLSSHEAVTQTAGGEAAKSVELHILASATCTLEEMFALKILAADHPGTACHVVRHVEDGVEDELLRKSDRHPNIKAAELLGIPLLDLREHGNGTGRDDSIAPGDGGALLAVGFDYGIGAPLQAVFEKFTSIVMVASRESGLTKSASVVVPGMTFAEKEGLVINFEGHIQSLSPAFTVEDRKSPWKVIAELSPTLSEERAISTIAELRDRIGGEEPAFSTVDLNAVGLLGLRLEPQAV
jgi:NADH-quinone oxidoreductase subunit G